MINLLQFELLQFEPLVFSNYAIFSNYNHGYADLPKCLWLCVKVQESSNIYFFIVSLLNITIKEKTSKYLVVYLPVKFTKALLEN